MGYSVSLILAEGNRVFIYFVMNEKLAERKKKKEVEKLKRKKNNALVLCKDGKQYWTTQKQFWQWFRERVIIKDGDYPLRGRFVDAHQEQMVIVGTTVLNLACPNHLSEALYARRFRTY